MSCTSAITALAEKRISLNLNQMYNSINTKEIKTALTASILVSELTVELILSKVIFLSTPKSDPNFSSSSSLLSSLKKLVLITTSLEFLIFCVCTSLFPAIFATTGTTFCSSSSTDKLSLKVTLVVVPPINSKL